jgi:hypothetical protein
MSDGNFIVKKLITKEDPQYAHKILGAVALANYIYRYYLLLVYGSMFINAHLDLALVGVHGLLSVSSLIFHIPAKRHAKMPMIYPEFRLHSIAFAMRSVICCFIEYFVTYEYKLYLKMAMCILHLCTFKPPIYISPYRLCRDAEYNKGGFISVKVTVAKAQSKTPDPSGRRLECAMV